MTSRRLWRGWGCLVLAIATVSSGCASTGGKTTADARDNLPPDEKPRGFMRELLDSGYLSHTTDPDAKLYP